MDKPQTTDREPIQQIVIEIARENDGSCAWTWDAFGEEHRLCGGSAQTLSVCLETMRSYLRDEGIAP